MFRLQCLRRLCIFGAYYLELFLTSPLVSVKLFLIYFKNGKWSFCFQHMTLHIFQPTSFSQLQFSGSHLPLSSSGQRPFWLTALLWQREGFTGDNSSPPGITKAPRVILCRDLLESSQSPTMHPATTVSTVTYIPRCPITRQTWILRQTIHAQFPVSV